MQPDLKRHKWLLIIPRCKVYLEAAVGRKDVAGAMQETAKTLLLAGGKKLRVFFLPSHFFLMGKVGCLWLLALDVSRGGGESIH
jgi:hypothetical protein